MKLLGSYKNGNYTVTLFDDGTKVRQNELDNLTPEKPESMDILITKSCEMECPMCHEDASPDGKHGDILNAPFLDTLLPYTELAIGGGNPLSHPDLIPFLERCRERNLIPNITVHAKHFVDKYSLIKSLIDRKLIYGVGVSIQHPNFRVMELLQTIPNAVIHAINGVIEIETLRMMYDKGFKILFLGYKDFRRGVFAHSEVTDKRMKELFIALPEITEHFKVVSFDNLAIRQLKPQRLVTKEQWDEMYMGDDGQFTMYVDMVNREFAKSSVSTERWPLMDDIKPMFDKVRGV